MGGEIGAYDIGTIGKCKLKSSQSEQKSKIKAKKINWEDFKRIISNLEGRKFLFRGQNEPWRLRTAFHRTGRADVQRFINEDIQVLYKHLSSRTKHVFNLDIGNENGAFFNLVQHHGYPTPLLDWSYSPYVAAFLHSEIYQKKKPEIQHQMRKLELLYLIKQLGKRIFCNTIISRQQAFTFQYRNLWR